MSNKLKRTKRIAIIKDILNFRLSEPKGIYYIENNLSQDDLDLFREIWNSNINEQDISKIIPIKYGKMYYCDKIKLSKKFQLKYARKFGIKILKNNKIGYTSSQKERVE